MENDPNSDLIHLRKLIRHLNEHYEKEKQKIIDKKDKLTRRHEEFLEKARHGGDVARENEHFQEELLVLTEKFEKEAGKYKRKNDELLQEYRVLESVTADSEERQV